MKTVLKSYWHNKRVIVAIREHYIPDGFNSHFHMRIKVEETNRLPTKFVRGVMLKANKDTVNTVGGLPCYVAKLLAAAEHQEYKRKTTTIAEQLTLF